MFGRDFVERVVTTFVEGFAGAVTLQVYTDLGWKAWLTAGAGAGLLAAIKSLIAKQVGSPNSASLDPKVGPLPPVR